MRLSRKAGFTLIELLVVVSIIALLVSILLPALSKAREQTKKVVCSTNMRSVGTGLLMYTLDHGTIPYPKRAEAHKGSQQNSAAWAQSLFNIVYNNDFEIGPQNDRTGMGWSGPGLLIRNGYLGNEMMTLWCPTKRFEGDGTYPHHNRNMFKTFDKWPEFFAANPHNYDTNIVLSAYRYQAIEPVDLMPAGQIEDLGALRFGNFKDRRKHGAADRTALLDEPGTNYDGDPTVVAGSTHKGGINVLKWDGHVIFVRYDFAVVSSFRYTRWFVQYLDRQD